MTARHAIRVSNVSLVARTHDGSGARSAPRNTGVKPGRARGFLARNAWLRDARGYTFVEILVVVTILLILASAVMPLAQVTSQRLRETELRRTLREIRTALDKFKDAADQGLIPATDLKPENEGYPSELETLVTGVNVANDASGRKLKFLRRVPVDPMTNSTEWGLRSYQDKPDATSWGGQNVFDVYTRSTATGLDGTKYKDW